MMCSTYSIFWLTKLILNPKVSKLVILILRMPYYVHAVYTYGLPPYLSLKYITHLLFIDSLTPITSFYRRYLFTSHFDPFAHTIKAAKKFTWPRKQFSKNPTLSGAFLFPIKFHNFRSHFQKICADIKYTSSSDSKSCRRCRLSFLPRNSEHLRAALPSVQLGANLHWDASRRRTVHFHVNKKWITSGGMAWYGTGGAQGWHNTQ